MFPHTLTLYMPQTCTHPTTLRTETTPRITVLEGVLTVPAKASTAGDKGYAGVDRVTVYIPFSVAATDGITGQEKRYMPPRAYAQAEDKTGLWTLSTAGKAFFIPGRVAEPTLTRQQLEQSWEVYSITSVTERDFGPVSMKHWEIGGA